MTTKKRTNKTIIKSEDVVKSGVLKEAMMFNQMPKKLRLSLSREKTPLSKNSALPYDNYLESECVKRFEELSQLEGIASPDSLSKIAREIYDIEKPIRNDLQQLCMSEVFSLFEVPSDKIDFLIRIVDSIDQSATNVPFGPNEELPPDLPSFDDVENLKLEVDKRRMQNAIVCGAALSYTYKILEASISKLDEFDQRLYDLYTQYLDINEYLLYYNGNEKQEQNQKNLTGIVMVTLGNDETKNQLDVQGTNYAVLVYETIKGLLEVFTSHGLPENSVLTKAVMAKSDYITAEPWYMRFGPFIWGCVETAMTKEVADNRTNLMPYIFMKISQLRPDKFQRLMRETLASTQKSKRVFQRVVDYAELKHEKSGFDDRMATYQDNASTVINDDEIL